jgi:hypothetical protein
MISLLLLRRQVFEQRDGRCAGLGRRHAVSASHRPDVRVRVGVDLCIFEAGGHIHDLRDGRVAEGARLKFRDVGRHRRGRIKLSLGNENTSEHAGERLGDRHGDVLLVGFEDAEVTLEDDAAAMQHRCRRRMSRRALDRK